MDPAEPQERSVPESTTAENGERRPFIVSTTAMADVTAQMLNSRVVLPSPTLASSHSGYASPLKPQSEHVYQERTLQPPEPPSTSSDDQLADTEAADETIIHEDDVDSLHEDDTERWLEHTTAEHESRMPPPVSSSSSSGSILGLSTPVAERSYPDEETREPEPARDRNSFLFIDDSAKDHSRDVSGPSFLGLGSDDVTYEEEEHTGRGRRYLLLAVLGIVAILGALEWRASQNGESTNPMDVLHLKLPQKKGQGQVQVVPPSSDSNTTSPTAPADNSNSPANPSADNSANTSTPGKPDLIADSNQSAAPKPTPDNASPNAAKTPPQDAAPQSGSPASQTASNATHPSASSTPPKPADTTAKTPSKPIEIAAANPPASASRKPVSAEPVKLTKPTATKPAPAATEAAPEQDASLNLGGAELQKGIAAGSTELGRMWLWKATAKGNGEAPVLLADMYAQGKGVPKDCEQAVLLLNAAAKKMNVRARSKLGSMYAAGECVPQDRVKAYKWMSAALEANPGSEWLEKNREALLRDMSPAERQRASR
jgi:hypothetical protein